MRSWLVLTMCALMGWQLQVSSMDALEVINYVVDKNAPFRVCSVARCLGPLHSDATTPQIVAWSTHPPAFARGDLDQTYKTCLAKAKWTFASACALAPLRRRQPAAPCRRAFVFSPVFVSRATSF